MLIFCRAVVTE